MKSIRPALLFMFALCLCLGADKLKVGCNTPGIIQLKLDEGKISQITVADLNRELKKIYLEINREIKASGENFRCNWIPEQKLTELAIELPQGDFAGQSVIMKL